MPCDMKKDQQMLAALSRWAQGSKALEWADLGERLREAGFFEGSPSEATIRSELERRVGVSARAVRVAFSAPYFRELLARGPESVAEAMLGRANSGRAMALGFSPMLELPIGALPERRATRREIGGAGPTAEQTRHMRRFEDAPARVSESALSESGAIAGGGEIDAPAEKPSLCSWKSGAGTLQGRWFWMAWSERAVWALAPLGSDPELAESSGSATEARERVERIKARLTRAFGEGDAAGLGETASRLREALGRGKGQGAAMELSPLGPPSWVAVWEALAKVPEGRSIEAAELARRAGLGRRADIAREACEENPIAMLIPCHRLNRAAARGEGQEAVQRSEDSDATRASRSMALLREFLRSRA